MTVVSEAVEATGVERARFAAESATRTADRLRSGMRVSIPVALALGPASYFGYPEARLGAVLPPLGAALVMAIGSQLARLPAVGRHSVALTAAMAWGVAMLAALAASFTGGYASPYVLILLLIWIFIAAFLPVSPRQLSVVALPLPLLFGVVLALRGLDPVPPVVLAVMLAGHTSTPTTAS